VRSYFFYLSRKRWIRQAALLLAAHAVGYSVCTKVGAQTTSPSASPTAESIADLEHKLSGAVLVGNFTVTGRQSEDSPRLISERYELSAVKHLKDEDWLFQTRIKYGEHDLKIPLTLPVKWAGDTPIITVDNMPFPGLGTYTARVMIYRDHYAGFWTGADHGGHLFGVVERATEEPQQEAETLGAENRAVE
jgi:hypothetical protein